MKVIIAGSRYLNPTPGQIQKWVEESGFAVAELVSGACRGVDENAERWASNCKIPIKQFPAEWDSYGSIAGPVRNTAMSKYGEALIAIPHPSQNGTGGTWDMIRKMRALGKPVHIVLL